MRRHCEEDVDGGAIDARGAGLIFLLGKCNAAGFEIEMEMEER